MRCVVQRVSSARVEVEGETVGEIGRGFLALVGVGHDDTEEHARQLAEKLARLRIFEDAEGKMNLAVTEVGGGVLAVSQFTLLADTRKGNRPSFAAAARPELAQPLYEKFCEALTALGVPVARGVFGAKMRVSLVNEGPVTVMLNLPPLE